VESRILCVFFFSSRRRHTRFSRDWSSDVCSSDLHTRQQDSDGGLTRWYVDGSRLYWRQWLTVVKARNSEKAQSMLFRFREQQARSEERRGGKEGRSRRAWSEQAEHKQTGSGRELP